MKSYRKISFMILNFNSKIICEKNFGKTCKNFLKDEVSTIRLNDRSQT